MNLLSFNRLKWASRLLAMPVPEPAEQAARILSVQRNIVLPARAMVIAVVYHYLFYSHWLDVHDVATSRELVLKTLQQFFIIYIVLNAIAAILLILKRFPPGLVQWVVFVVGLLDGLLLAGLTVETGGFSSTLFWVFPGLILVNALSIPLATPQIVLNLSLSAFYLGAGLLGASVNDSDMWLPALPARLGSRTFAMDDVRDLNSLAARLRAQRDPVSKYVWTRLPETTRQEVQAYNGSGTASNALQASLVTDLNKLIRGESIYEQARFAGVGLSQETKALLSEDVEGERLARLNRLLLEDSYPSEIVRNHRSVSAPLKWMRHSNDRPPADLEAGNEPFLLQLIILWLMTASCYGVQLLAFRDRQAEEEAREAAARNSELKAAGRLAAEIAHQLKNPLGIINNAVFSLERGLRHGKNNAPEQIEIIREEIQRSDRIITQLMGYAQLSEGRVEKLGVLEELDRAVAEVFPPAANYPTQIHRDYRPNLPTLMMQRTHLSAVLVNLMQNAREAMNGQGNLSLSAHAHRDSTVEIIVADDGPGIPPDKVSRIFDPYFTSKARGTGLGLAIVKHNVELYGGTVGVESKLGKGARFIILFPARTHVK
jgi:signal transduction histidine kinase